MLLSLLHAQVVIEAMKQKGDALQSPASSHCVASQVSSFLLMLLLLLFFLIVAVIVMVVVMVLVMVILMVFVNGTGLLWCVCFLAQ